jgi:hypothetical protein
MSSAPPPPPPPPAAVPAIPPPPATPTEITIVSHSNFFYWWPVWAVGFVMAVLTWFSATVVAIIPDENSRRQPAALTDIKLKDKGDEKYEGVIMQAKPGQQLDAKKDRLPRQADNEELAEQPHLRVAANKMYGIIFVFVLLFVIIITNVPLRGMWSILVILLAVLLIVILALANLWTPLLDLFGHLDIRVTMGGYITISLVLFIVWLITFLFFDRQVYMTFTPGQLKVSTEIGGGEKVYDAIGMTLEKQRSDLFRHWILGLGSGDLIVRTSGAQAHQFDLPNVLFIGSKVAMIEEMLKKKSVVETQ